MSERNGTLASGLSPPETLTQPAWPQCARPHPTPPRVCSPTHGDTWAKDRSHLPWKLDSTGLKEPEIGSVFLQPRLWSLETQDTSSSPSGCYRLPPGHSRVPMA